MWHTDLLQLRIWPTASFVYTNVVKYTIISKKLNKSVKLVKQTWQAICSCEIRQVVKVMKCARQKWVFYIIWCNNTNLKMVHHKHKMGFTKRNDRILVFFKRNNLFFFFPNCISSIIISLGDHLFQLKWGCSFEFKKKKKVQYCIHQALISWILYIASPNKLNLAYSKL